MDRRRQPLPPEGSLRPEASDPRNATVDLEVGAVDVAGLIRGKECDNVSHLNGLRIATERYLAGEVVVESFQVGALTRQPVKALRNCVAWANRPSTWAMMILGGFLSIGFIAVSKQEHAVIGRTRVVNASLPRREAKRRLILKEFRRRHLSEKRRKLRLSSHLPKTPTLLTSR